MNSGSRRRSLRRLGALALGCGALFALGQRLAVREPSLEEALQKLRAALESPDRLVRAQRLTPILLALGPSDLSAVADVYEASFAAGRGGGLALELFVERFASLDPLRARDRISGWPRERRHDAYPALLRTWARSDPRTATEALGEIQDAEIRNASFGALIEGWSEAGRPEAVWRYLATLGGMERERGSQVALRSRIARLGAEAALREIEALPEEPPLASFKDKLLRTAVALVARSQPSVATAVVDAHRNDSLGDALMRRVAVNWVTQDGVAAMAWIRSRPATAQRERVLREAYRRWVVRDRAAAIRWMAEQAELGDLRSILDIHASALARSDPQAAIAWLAGIEDPAIRRDALLDVAEVWLHEDPAAAKVWLLEAGLRDALDERRRRRRARTRAAGLAPRSEDEPAPES